MIIWVLRVVVMFILTTGIAIASEAPQAIAGYSSAEALVLGERIYREGILPSGEPMQAVVMSDIPVDGRMFTCDDCHQRSGLGSVEGTVITWPTNGKDLYKPRRRTGAWRQPESEAAKKDARKNLPPYWQVEDVRPAYTDESLARVLRAGIDPAGRKLDPIMPCYMLDDRDMTVLIHYLKNLSVDPAPGVDDTTIRFATVITEGVADDERQAMLATLQAHIEARNSQNRHQERRAAAGPWYKTEMHQAYRRLQLDVWELRGPAASWAKQLEDYYRKDPVFGLLGGISAGSWQPIHDFCEQHRIPSILPLTELPVISDSDWYTLYFSKGLYQEGEAAARYLHAQKSPEKDIRIVQVFRKGLQGRALAQGFAETWQRFNQPAAENRDLKPDQILTEYFWQEVAGTQDQTILLLWLNPSDLADLGSLAAGKNRPLMIFVAGSLLDKNLAIISDTMRDRTYITYPSILPADQDRRLMVVKRWLQARNIPVTNLEMQAKMYFLGWMLPGALKHMRSEFFREYFMEGFDMMIDQDYAIAVYPRLTFGPGQRYASKGCYIVQLTPGPKPELVLKSAWVIH